MYEAGGTDGQERRIETAEVAGIIEELNKEYEAAQRPYRIVVIAGGYQFATLPDYAEWLGKLFKEQARRKLSQSSVEALAIIAYRQPISKPEIEAIRGVNCDYVLKTLLEKELVTIVGRAPTPGRPLLYGTTKDFLKYFGLNDVSDLPRPREIEEILGESQFEAERRMLEAQQSMPEAKKEEEDFKSRLPHIPKRKPELDETVKIVPKQKTRELKIRTEEKKGQESLPLINTSETPQQDSAGETVPPQAVPTSAQADMPTGSSMDSSLRELGQDERMAGENIEHSEDTQSTSLLATHLRVGTEPSAIETPTDVPTEQEREVEVLYDQPSPDTRKTEEQGLVETVSPSAEELVQQDDRNSVEVQLESPSEAMSQVVTPILDCSISMPEKVTEMFEDSTLEVETKTAGLIEDAESRSELQSEGELVQPPVVESESLSAAPREGSRSHPKSKWQTWKEKIQGFIKKLFG